MKFAILLLPTLLQIAFILAIHSEAIAPPPLTPVQRHGEIRQLRSELKGITARLDGLQSQGQQFMPRGGLSADTSRRFEYFSNQRFFLTDTPGILARAQDTSTFHLVYSSGAKDGAW